jgi:DNA-binding FadR family transcriptional regulator
VVGHILFGAAGLDRPTLSAVMEARRAMLAEVGRLACERRTEDQRDPEAAVRAISELAGEQELRLRAALG